VDVEELYRVGKQAWPEVVLDREHFASALARHAACDGLKGADLYLAAACVAGDRTAIETVRTMLAAELKFAAGKSNASQDQISEATARLSSVLFVDEEERPAALRTYSGRGELKAYLSVVAHRELMRVVNRARREVDLDADVIDYIVPPKDPEISLLRERYRSEVDDALRAAVRALDERDRALLRYAFIDGLNVDAIGKLYDVHRATGARWVAAARERLGTKIREELAARLKIGVDEVDSIVRLVQSRIDVSLERVLGV
jgi:RNA polymerase sigma-70 factor (ECF subfamily)